MSARGVFLFGIVLAIFSFCSCCDPGNATSFKLCVEEVLMGNRSELESQLEPLTLPNATGNGTLRWIVTNVTVSGLGNFSIQGVDVDVENQNGVKIKFAVFWQPITLRANAKFLYCIRGRRIRQCYWLTGYLTISVMRPLGSEDISLDLSTSSNCTNQQQLKFSRTALFDFRNVSVGIQLVNWNRALAERIGFPYTTFENEMSTNYWNKTAAKLVDNTIQSVI